MFDDPKHPYTAGLLHSIPDPEGAATNLEGIPGFQRDYGSDWVKEFAEYYLGKKHQRDLECGCAMATLTPEVVGRHVFYNNSAFDGNDPSANAADDAAVAVETARSCVAGAA